jgi:hypothetical protein
MELRPVRDFRPHGTLVGDLIPATLLRVMGLTDTFFRALPFCFHCGRNTAIFFDPLG